MVIDTSVLIAILLREPDAAVFSSAIANAPKRLVSVFSALETSIVIEAKKGEPGEPLLFKGDDFSKTDVQSALQRAQE